MGVTAIVGANWGDEGKGRMTDYLAGRSDYVVRFQGGGNAGHTVINQYGKFALHLLPSGVFHRHVTNVVGPGVALDIPDFMDELDSLASRGVPAPDIVVSERTQVLLPWHKQFDIYEEDRLGDAGFGSTKSGIAPFYADKYYKIGVQAADLFDGERLKRRLGPAAEAKNILLKDLYGKPAIRLDELVSQLLEQGEKIKPYLCDTASLLDSADQKGKEILLEGQLGALRDPDHGIYPFVSSSSPLAGFGAVGAGVPPWKIRNIIAVIKAYSSCIGAGPFTAEIGGEAAHELRERGADSGEYGAKTGRPRRVGRFDAVAVRHGCRAQGATAAALTLLDVLGYMDEIPVCVAYEIDGRTTCDFPVTAKLERARPVFESLPGWKCDISTVRRYSDLPRQAKRYTEFVEEAAGVPVKWISVGPHRDAMIEL